MCVRLVGGFIARSMAMIIPFPSRDIPLPPCFAVPRSIMQHLEASMCRLRGCLGLGSNFAQLFRFLVNYMQINSQHLVDMGIGNLLVISAGPMDFFGPVQVVVYGQAVDTAATETKGTVLIENAAQLESYSRSEEDKMEALIKGMKEAGASVVRTVSLNLLQLVHESGRGT